MTGHRGWEGQGGGYRESQPVSRVLRAAGWRINNDRRAEGMRVTTAYGDRVRVSLDYDIPRDDLPTLLLEIAAALTTTGRYRVESLHADRDAAWIVVERKQLKRGPKKVTRSGGGSGVDEPPTGG